MTNKVPIALLSVVKTLTTTSEHIRRDILYNTLLEFDKIPEEKRIEEMSTLIRAIDLLDESQRRIITRSRIESLMTLFDDHSRKRLMTAHFQALMNMPEEIVRNELKTVAAVIPELEKAEREVALATVRSLVNDAPPEQQERVLNLFPEDFRKRLGI